MGIGLGLCTCCTPVAVSMTMSADWTADLLGQEAWDSETGPYAPLYGKDTVTVTCTGFGGPDAGVNATHTITDSGGDVTRANRRSTITGSVTVGSSVVTAEIYQNRESDATSYTFPEADTITVRLGPGASDRAVFTRAEGGTSYTCPLTVTAGSGYTIGSITVSVS